MRADPNPLHGGVSRGWSFGGSVGRCGSADPSRFIDPPWRDRCGRNPGSGIRDFVPRGVGSDSPVLHGQRLERERGVCLGRSGLGRHRPIRDCSTSCARRLRGRGRHHRRTRVPPVGSAAGDAGAGGAVVHAARRAARRFGLVPVDGAGQWSGPFRNPRAWGRGWPAQRSHRCLPRRSNLRFGAGRVRSVGSIVFCRKGSCLSSPREQPPKSNCSDSPVVSGVPPRERRFRACHVVGGSRWYR